MEEVHGRDGTVGALQLRLLLKSTERGVIEWKQQGEEATGSAPLLTRLGGFGDGPTTGRGRGRRRLHDYRSSREEGKEVGGGANEWAYAVSARER